jgi:hypothetical protein
MEYCTVNQICAGTGIEGTRVPEKIDAPVKKLAQACDCSTEILFHFGEESTTMGDI